MFKIKIPFIFFSSIIKIKLKKFYFNFFLLKLNSSKKNIYLSFSFNKKLIKNEKISIKKDINNIKIILNFLIFFF